MRNTYNEQAKGNFAKTYLAALQAIIRFDEQLAGNRLNKVRDVMNSLNQFSGDALSGGNSAEKAIFNTLRNNKVMERGVLYGDYKSNEKTPWIKDPVLLGMIKRHVQRLGSPEDKEVLQGFLAKTEAFFGPTAKPVRPAQRVLPAL